MAEPFRGNSSVHEEEESFLRFYGLNFFLQKNADASVGHVDGAHPSEEHGHLPPEASDDAGSGHDPGSERAGVNLHKTFYLFGVGEGAK